PTSIWLPALADVEKHALEAAAPAPEMTQAELTKALAAQVGQWEKAVLKQDDDADARARRALRDLSERHAMLLKAMMRDPDDSVRALGVFAGSSGESPEHLAGVMMAVRAPAARVRAWAAQGLAARGDRLTDPDILRKLMGDDDPTVRARACA